MLVLSRKRNQAIYVDGVEIKILNVTGGRVSLGIVATREVRVLRGELVERDKQRELERAAKI